MADWLHLLQLKTVGNYILLKGFGGHFGFVKLMGLFSVALAAWWLAGLLAGFVFSRRLVRRSRPVTGPSLERVLDIYGETVGKLGFCSTPPLFESRYRRLPAFTAGLFKPSVFIHPGLAASLTAEELEATFAHELLHVKRRDNLLRAAFELSLTALPMTAALVVAAVSELPAFLSKAQALSVAVAVLLCHAGLRLMFRSLREISCDAGAARRVGDPLSLASSLLKTWRFKQQDALVPVPVSQRLGTSLLAGGFSLEGRIRRLVKDRGQGLLGAASRGLLACAMAAVVLTDVFLIDFHGTDHYKVKMVTCSTQGAECGALQDPAFDDARGLAIRVVKRSACCD